MMKQYVEENTDFFCSVFTELKALGVKVPKIKKFKSSIPKQARPVSTSSNNKIFGISINEQEKISVENYLLPKFIVTSTNYLKKFIDREIGLFRKAGSVLRQRDLRVKLERGESIENSEPNDIASLLKQWLRELPEPLIPTYLHNLFIRCLSLQVEDNRVAAILLCCHLLPVDHFCTLKHLLDFLSVIAKHCDKNKMGAYNLALIMAPNIFVMGNDSIDKSSNGLVQQHTSVIELLINNAHRVGLPCSSPHLAEAEALKCDTDLDSSTDILDFTPCKSKKKRRSGPVQDLFTGFKKLVGQNSLSPGRKRSNQDDYSSDTRSALKRKADDDHLPSMSPLKKLATGSVLNDESSSNTPNNKIPKTTSDTNDKPRKGHTRRKSFGLLKRKEKKRQNSLKSNALDSKLSISTPTGPFQETLLSSLQVPAENKDSFLLPPSISPINFENLFSKSGFMKKSASDCYLISNNERPQKMFSTSSEGCLPVEGIPSPYSLRPTTLAKTATKCRSDERSSKTNSFISPSKLAEVDKENSSQYYSFKAKEEGHVFTRSLTPKILNSKNVNISLKDGKFNHSERSYNLNVSNDMDSLKVPDIVIPQAISCEKISESSKTNNSSLVSTAEKSVSDFNLFRSNVKDVNDGVRSITLTQSDVVSSIPSRLRNGEKVKRNCSISRQETIIIRPKNLRKSTLNQLKRADSIKISKSRSNRVNNQNVTLNNTSVIDNKIAEKSDCSSAEVFSSGKTDESKASNKRSIKRNVRNGSIVRGRPNTVKTGLPTDVCSRYSNDSVSSSRHQALSSSCSVDNDLFINVVQKSEKSDPDLSLIRHIQDLTLSPKEMTSVGKGESKVEVLNQKEKIIISLENDKPESEIKNCADTVTVSTSVTKTVLVSDFVEASTVNEVSITGKMLKQNEPESIKTEDPKTVTKRKSRERLCSNSDSKIHKTRKKSTKITRMNSFPERVVTTKVRKVEKLRAVKSSSPMKLRSTDDKMSGNTDKENKCCKESHKQTHLNVKTPEDKGKSPEQWFSGRKFLEAEEASEKEICDHKRESIAMILRNNQGHVRAKASLYDCRTRTSFNNTPMMLRSATPRDKSCSSQYTNTPSAQKKNTSTRSTKTRRNSPLPPPPKFVIPEPSPVASYPLKELTNLSNSEEIFFTPPSAPKSFNSPHPNGENSSKKKRKCTLKPKMNSYSGHTPYKPPVDRLKVFRSESSPFLQTPGRPSRKSVENLPLNSSLTKCHSPSSNENLYSSPVFKTRSALSIEKLKSNELLDEWHCEM